MAASGIDAAAILADGRVVVTDAGRQLRVIDPSRTAVIAELTTPTRVRSLRPSTDGRRLVTMPVRAKSVPPVLWDLERYSAVAELKGHSGRVFSARFVRDGILTAGADGTARLWDAASGRLRRTFAGASRFLGDAVLSPDGSMVVAGGGDGLLRFWDATTGRQLWTLRAHRPYVVGLHFEGGDLVSRGFAGDVSRWTIEDIQPPLLESLSSCLSRHLDGETGAWIDQPNCDLIDNVSRR
jgi:WD40 repeat protein